MDDTRYVYSSGCTWNESIHKVSKTRSLPCCPHCGSVLFELDSEDEWLKGAAKYDKDHPGYLDFIKWLKGKCFPGLGMAGLRVALKKYQKKTGKTVENFSIEES